MAPSDEDRIDFSPLDPTRDALRFERMVRSVAARAALQRPSDAGALLVRWWRPALLVAASLAVASWTPALLSRRATPAIDPSDPAAGLLQWATGGGSSPELLDTLGRNQ